MLSRGQVGFDVVWVPVCPSTASGRDVTVGKVSHPQSPWADLPASPLWTGRKIRHKSRARWKCGAALGDAGCGLQLPLGGCWSPSPISEALVQVGVIHLHCRSRRGWCSAWKSCCLASIIFCPC